MAPRIFFSLWYSNFHLPKYETMPVHFRTHIILGIATVNFVPNLWISLELCQDLRDQSTICSRYFLHTYSPQLSIESGRHNNSLALMGRSSIHLCLKYSSYRVLNTAYKIRKLWTTTWLKIIFWMYLGIFRDYGWKNIFFGIKTFLFFKLESWNFQHLS